MIYKSWIFIAVPNVFVNSYNQKEWFHYIPQTRQTRTFFTNGPERCPRVSWGTHLLGRKPIVGGMIAPTDALKSMGILGHGWTISLKDVAWCSIQMGHQLSISGCEKCIIPGYKLTRNTWDPYPVVWLRFDFYRWSCYNAKEQKKNRLVAAQI